MPEDIQERTRRYDRLSAKAAYLVNSTNNKSHRIGRLAAMARICGAYLHSAAYSQLTIAFDPDTNRDVRRYAHNMMVATDLLLQTLPEKSYISRKTRMIICADGLNSITALSAGTSNSKFEELWHGSHNELCIRDTVAAEDIGSRLEAYLQETCHHKAPNGMNMPNVRKAVYHRLQALHAKISCLPT